MQRRALVAVVAIMLTAACSQPGGSDASPSATAPVSPTPTTTQSATPAPTFPVAECAGLTDNTDAPVPTFSPGQTIYYGFGCYDERVLVQIVVGQETGGVAFVPLQSEYSFGQMRFTANGISVTSTITSLNQTREVPLSFYGTPTDLRLKSMVRTVGPTADVADFKDQDCADLKSMGVKDCSGEFSPRFLREGAAAGWVNEFGT